MSPLEAFTNAELAAAQVALDTHPNDSPYWDTMMGQETLIVARTHGLKAQTTDAERIAAQKALRQRQRVAGRASARAVELYEALEFAANKLDDAIRLAHCTAGSYVRARDNARKLLNQIRGET